MAENSGIEWTHHTFNPWRGCTKVSEGCANCYADTLSKRNPKTLGIWGPNGTRVVAAESQWKQPLKWNRSAVLTCDECGNVYHSELVGNGDDPVQRLWDFECLCGCSRYTPSRPRVFCASLADVFEDWDGPLHRADGSIVTCSLTGLESDMNSARRRLFQLIDDTPNLDWLVLTKRPENIRRMWQTPESYRLLSQWYGRDGFDKTGSQPERERYRPNVWLGTSVENQEQADKRIPELLKCRDLSPVLFLSCEPLLGPVDLHDYLWAGELPQTRKVDGKGIVNWLICGGESGHGARPMHPEWARSLRDQCQAAEVPFLFKQWGEHCYPEQMTASTYGILDAKHNFGGGACYDEPHPVGKKAAGRLLDGREWNEFPEVLS